MESHIVKILDTKNVTHDVKYFRVEKPEGYSFVPGQATDVSIHQAGLETELRPFTFTALNEKPYLEFTIKRYPDHKGITDHLHKLTEGEEIIIHDVWGAINYKGPGYFIAGGAGITPFISILRDLYHRGEIDGNELFFSNKTSQDIIYESELKKMLGNNAHFLLTREEKPGYIHARLNKEFLRKNISDFKKHFYICGPDEMVKEVSDLLREEGASEETLVFEK